jgi:hypothetical protein
MVLLLVSMGLLLFGGFTSAAASTNTFTIHGKVVYADGRPAPGLKVILLAHTPADGIDRHNAIWQIPNYDQHPVTTDGAGNFVMTGVIDYPENKDKTYVVAVANEKPDVFYHGSARFRLRPETPTLEIQLPVEDVTIVRLHLKDRNGRPFEGTRVVWINTGSGAATRDLANGYNQLKNVKFVGGVGIVKVPVRDKITYMGRIAILGYPSAEALRKEMKTRGMQTGDDRFDALKFTVRDARGQAMDRQVKLLPQQTQDFEFVL